MLERIIFAELTIELIIKLFSLTIVAVRNASTNLDNFERFVGNKLDEKYINELLTERQEMNDNKTSSFNIPPHLSYVQVKFVPNLLGRRALTFFTRAEEAA